MTIEDWRDFFDRKAGIKRGAIKSIAVSDPDAYTFAQVIGGRE